MAKKKEEPKSWSDKLQEDAATPTKPPHEDPLVQQIAETHKVRDLEIQVMVLKRELYLAKARILELELNALGVRTESS
jgi:hypothetical protein